MASLTNGPSGASKEPRALACSSSVTNPADLSASASSLILHDCRAFILAVSGSGRWLRGCPRAADDGRNTSDRCDSLHRFPSWTLLIQCLSAAAPQVCALLTRVASGGYGLVPPAGENVRSDPENLSTLA